MQDIEKDQMMSDTYGHILNKLLAVYDQVLLSWKTSEAISVSDSKKFSQTLPKSGMTQDGKLYELVMLAHPTKGRDYSLLPTPLASDSHRGSPADVKRHSPALRTMDVLPTPTVIHVRNHDEPLAAYISRVKDYEMGKTKGKPGMSTGLACRWIDRQFRVHWIKID
jgi:hypothetical protein